MSIKLSIVEQKLSYLLILAAIFEAILDIFYGQQCYLGIIQFWTQ